MIGFFKHFDFSNSIVSYVYRILGVRKILEKLSSDLARYLFLIILSIAIFVPLYYMFMTSFKTHNEYLWNKLSPPRILTIENFRSIIFEQNFLLYMYNSLKITLFSGILCTVTSTLAAFSFSNYKFRLKNLLYILLISLIGVPPVVMVIPLYIQCAQLKIIGDPISAIIIYTGLTIPFSLYLLTNFFKTVPKELKEAAAIDGCTDLQYFLRVIIPLSKPAIASVVIVNAIWVWNELLIALIFLPKEASRTLMAGIMLRIGKFSVNVPLVASGLAVASIPMIVLFLLFQGWFVRGLVEGSIKG